MNKYTKTGILGFVISIIIHTTIALTKGIEFGEIFPLYFMCAFFLAIGIGHKLEEKQDGKSNNLSV